MYLTFRVITGSDDPKGLAKIFSSSNAELFLKGDLLYPQSSRSHPKNGVRIKIEQKRNLSVDRLLTRFFALIRDHKKLKKFLKIYPSELCIVLYAYDRSAELWVSPKNLIRIAELGLDFGIDYYMTK